MTLVKIFKMLHIRCSSNYLGAVTIRFFHPICALPQRSLSPLVVLGPVPRQPVLHRTQSLAGYSALICAGKLPGHINRHQPNVRNPQIGGSLGDFFDMNIAYLFCCLVAF